MARYSHSTDSKGRVFIPSKLRDTMGKTLYVTRAIDDNYLVIYTEAAYYKIRDDIEKLPSLDPIVRRLRREIIGETVQCNMDSQGRITISEELWSLIGVEAGDNVSLSDVSSAIEVCSQEFYEQSRKTLGSLSELDFSRYDVHGIL